MSPLNRLCNKFSLIDCCICLYCRIVSLQKSCSVFGLLLLGVCGWLTLSCKHSRLHSGGFLHGLRVNIRCQLCASLHQPETKERYWRNEGKGWIERVPCEIQHSLFFFSFFCRSCTGSEEWILSHCVSALFTPIKTFKRNRTGWEPLEICKMILHRNLIKQQSFLYISVYLQYWLHTHLWILYPVLCDLGLACEANKIPEVYKPFCTWN